MTARPSCHLCHGTGRIARLVGWEAPDVRYDECYCTILPNRDVDDLATTRTPTARALAPL